MFFKHFASKNQLPGFYKCGLLVENGLTLGAIISFFIYSSCESLCLLVAIHEKEPENAT